MYAKASVFSKKYDVHPSTLRRWADAGKIDYRWSPGGTRLYKLPADGLPTGGEQKKKKVVYARVSSSKQKDDLQRQGDFLLSKFPGHILVTDIGSGINWKRRGLLSILDGADKGDIQEVVVASRDRLCRFAFELVEHVLRSRGVKLIVLDATDASPEQELSDDLLSIVQIFCCRRNGKRRYSGGGTDGAAADAENQAEPHAVAEGDPEPIRRRL
mgnify:CR=1 FL=1